MLRVPRFSREDVNPRFTAEADIGALFQQFAWEVFLRDFSDLRNFAGSGRDGAIDQSATHGDLRTVIECKFLGEDGLPRALQAWREVAAHLSKNLADPAGPPSGQPQYGPWYRREPPTFLGPSTRSTRDICIQWTTRTPCAGSSCG